MVKKMNTKKEPLEELVEKMLKEQNHNPRDCSQTNNTPISKKIT